ncbi:MAG: peptidoglycan DD-metalloendopeptidase family protein [Bacteroidales bacterium]|nr:peptidoglycan DD-metalloendopeptidase family protein [Bacteroidales bacterium]
MRGFNILYSAAVAAACLFSLGAKAQDTVITTKKQAELIIPRPAFQPVQSMDPTNAQAMDTISTANPYIKIILFSDYSWKYIKDPEFVASNEVFSEYWTHDYPDPYRASLESLPNEIGIWVVDSLSQYRCPNQTKVYSKFGYRHRRRHQGVDLPLQTGTPVYAAFDGKVRLAKYYKGYGNLVVLRHENGLETFYGHLSKIMVSDDEWVSAGSIIGLGGSTGRSTGPHLHFETRYRGYAFDPEWLIDFESGVLRHRFFTLKKKYLNASSNYVPEDEQEEIDIIEGDTLDKEEAERKAEEARKAAAAAQYHTIRQGDTLGALAVKYHTTVKKLCQLNGISERTILRLGRKIRVK